MADDQTEIKNPKHAESCFAKMQSLFEKEVLCDLTLKVGDSLFKVHKFLLVSQSKYFENMLLGERFVESKESLVELDKIDSEHFRKILRYFYYGSIMVSMKDIEGILKLADYFLVDKLKMFCTEYLQKKIDKENCVWGFLLADKYKLKDDYQCQTLTLISTNIEEASKTDDFCKLSQHQLVEILNYNANNGCSENLFNAIFRWIAYDTDNRKHLIFDLVKILSTRGLTPSFLRDNLLNEPLMKESSDCNKWLLDVIHERLTVQNSVCDDNANALFVASTIKNVSYSLNVSSREFKLLSQKPKDIRGFCVCSHKDNVFLLGGEYEGKAYNKSLKINSGKQEWEELNWELGLRDAGVCVLSNEIYIVGGFNIDQQTASNSFRVCDLETGKQIRLRGMIQQRRYPALCTYGGSLYACCGKDGAINLDTIERYDPREGHWEMHATLPGLYGSCSAAIWDDKMFVCKSEMDGNWNVLYQERILDFKSRWSNNFLKESEIEWFPIWNCTFKDKLFSIETNGELLERSSDSAQIVGSFSQLVANFSPFGGPIIVPWTRDAI